MLLIGCEFSLWTGIFTAIVIAMAFGFVPSSYVVFVVRERETKVNSWVLCVAAKRPFLVISLRVSLIFCSYDYLVDAGQTFADYFWCKNYAILVLWRQRVFETYLTLTWCARCVSVFLSSGWQTTFWTSWLTLYVNHIYPFMTYFVC